MPDKDIPPRPDEAHTLGLLLVDGFSLMSYAHVIEPYRAANVLAGRTLYRWRHISIDGAPSRASTGATIFADDAVGTPLACDTLFVFVGGDPSLFDDRKTFAWLRQLAAAGTHIAGISGGPFVLARAGLLDGYRATIHWDHRLAFAEAFPAISLEQSVYVIDRRRITCAGGMAGADLAVELIEREQGAALAARISDWIIRSEPRTADRSQRLRLRDRYDIHDDHVLKALAAMEAHVEETLSLERLARIAAISPRQLARLFRRTLGETIGGSYMRIRLIRAQHLLRTTALSTTAIAIRCGFKGSSHFSRSYHKLFGHPPSLDRHRSAGAGTPPPESAAPVQKGQSMSRTEQYPVPD